MSKTKRLFDQVHKMGIEIKFDVHGAYALFPNGDQIRFHGNTMLFSDSRVKKIGSIDVDIFLEKCIEMKKITHTEY